jgi:hypothetical protein
LQFDEIPEESMLRTPSAIEGQGGAIREDVARAKNRMLMVRDQMAQLAQENGLKVSPALLPTPVVRDHKDGSVPHIRHGKVATDTVARAVFNSGEVSGISWGKFEPAIRRWETILGRPAPDPTEPTGKDGAHRLSPWLTEWMMGLPSGWVCGHGLTRTQELKLAGNGVCPQQAVLALTLLTEGLTLD